MTHRAFVFLSVFAVLLSDGLDPAVSRSGSRIGSGRTGGSCGAVAARAVISASAASVAVLISAASVSAGRSGAAVEGLHALFEGDNDLAVILCNCYRSSCYINLCSTAYC